jgi:DNA polymerase III sliding clamp (beta) subunit (PCNA family)
MAQQQPTEATVQPGESADCVTGILVSASDSELRMAATDSYRLSVKTT